MNSSEFESKGVIYPAAMPVIRRHTSRLLGINCCAVCAQEEQKGQGNECSQCTKVYYCSRLCSKADVAHSEHICRLLKQTIADSILEERSALTESVIADACTREAAERLLSERDSYPKTLLAQISRLFEHDSANMAKTRVCHIIGASQAELDSVDLYFGDQKLLPNVFPHTRC
jgi:hypothetical protein